MLAAVVIAKNAELAAKEFSKADDADLIELRLDYFNRIDLGELESLIKSSKKPLIITLRKKSEGGFFRGNEKYRLYILKKAVSFGADYVDVEYSASKKEIADIIINKANSKVIVSHHNFNSTPADLKNIYSKIKKLNPDLIKIVPKANSVIDNFKVFGLIMEAKKENRKIVSFCMGRYGQFSRIISQILGSMISYCPIDDGKRSAEGQLTLREMAWHYRAKKLNKNTKIFGLIGNPVEHSWSHIIHNAAFEEIGINAVYVKFRVDRLEKFIEHVKKLSIGGFSVTIPHKVEIMKCIDSVDKKAKEIGAVNTIAIRKNKLIGFNTDCYGAMQALKKVVKIRNTQIVVIGTGGAARAIAYGLKENGAKPTVLSRTKQKAAKFGKEFDVEYDVVGNLGRHDYGALINATPIGMHPNIDESPVPSELVPKNCVVMDAVFNPLKTKLIKDAEVNGCAVVPGIEMLINQAMLQFRLWTGKDAPEKIMRKKILGYLENAYHKN